MKYTMFSCFLFIFNVAFSQALSLDSKSICWTENVRLKWSDFQSDANPLDANDPLSDINAANAASEIIVEPIDMNNGSHNFLVTVVFNKSKSWVRDVSLSTSAMLIHEQFHFNIAELVGRKVRLKIEQARKAGIDVFCAKFGEEIKLALNEESEIDALYDKETDHGNIKDQQIKWQNYIKTELAKLGAYKSTVATCP